MVSRWGSSPLGSSPDPQQFYAPAKAITQSKPHRHRLCPSSETARPVVVAWNGYEWGRSASHLVSFWGILFQRGDEIQSLKASKLGIQAHGIFIMFPPGRNNNVGPTAYRIYRLTTMVRVGARGALAGYSCCAGLKERQAKDPVVSTPPRPHRQDIQVFGCEYDSC